VSDTVVDWLIIDVILVPFHVTLTPVIVPAAAFGKHTANINALFDVPLDPAPTLITPEIVIGDAADVLTT
jgi:hypothetical protein